MCVRGHHAAAQIDEEEVEDLGGHVCVGGGGPRGGHDLGGRDGGGRGGGWRKVACAQCVVPWGHNHITYQRMRGAVQHVVDHDVALCVAAKYRRAKDAHGTVRGSSNTCSSSSSRQGGR